MSRDILLELKNIKQTVIPDDAKTGKEICLRKGEALPETQAVEATSLV